MKVNFGKTDSADKFYVEYVFRITDGNNPLKSGSWSKDNPLENATDEIYISPVIYSWIGHYFKNETDRIYAIKRPKNLTGTTMCCGLNSHYHFIHTKHPELLKKMRDAVINNDYSDKQLQKAFKEHEQRVLKRFGKKLSEMKGGLYLGTLEYFDKYHPKDAYPEIIISSKLLKGCEWEELEHLGRGVFKGKKSKKTFRIEQTISSYGDRYKKPDSEIFG